MKRRARTSCVILSPSFTRSLAIVLSLFHRRSPPLGPSLSTPPGQSGRPTVASVRSSVRGRAARNGTRIRRSLAAAATAAVFPVARRVSRRRGFPPVSHPSASRSLVRQVFPSVVRRPSVVFRSCLSAASGLCGFGFAIGRAALVMPDGSGDRRW